MKEVEGGKQKFGRMWGQVWWRIKKGKQNVCWKMKQSWQLEKLDLTQCSCYHF